MTNCLTQPVTFFCLPMKKSLSKTTTENLSSEEMWNKHMEQCIKSKRFSHYIYSIGTL